MLKNYPGAKTNSGIIPFLVNEIPYHERYFELFAGSAQLFRNKVRAKVNFLNDVNPLVVAELFSTFGHEQEVIRYSSFPLLELLKLFYFTRKDFIYLDPPYPEKARRSGAKIYKHEMLTDDSRVQLLNAVRYLEANIMISSSPNDLYDQELKDWRKLEFETMGHRGKRIEVIFMNYEKPAFLHQYDLLGADCWDRQQITRMRSRFADKVKRVDTYTRHIMIEELIKKDRAAVQHFLSVRHGDTGK